MALTNQYTGQNVYQPPNVDQARAAASANVKPTSFLGSLGNMFNSGLKAINDVGSTMGIGVNTVFPGLVPKWNSVTNNQVASQPKPYGVVPPVQNLSPDQLNALIAKNNTKPQPTNAPMSLPQNPPSANIVSNYTPSNTTSAQGNIIQNMAQNDGTNYGKIVNNLANLRGNNPDVQRAYNSAINLESGLQEGNNAIMAKPIPLEFQQGQMAALQRDYGPQLTAARGILDSALSGQQRELSGLQTAGQLASPIQVPYSNQIINPLNGQPIGGGSGTMQDAVNLQIQKVKNGTATPQQAQDALSAYGQAGVNMLQQGLGSGFNINQAQVNAQTQGSLAPQSSLASQELQNLQNTLNSVPAWQKSTFPALNALGSWIDNALGMGSAQELTSATSAARSAIETALGTAYNTTPTAFTSMVEGWIPNNPTPSQVQAAINQFDTLMKARISSFGNPGTTTNPLSNTSTGTSNIFDPNNPLWKP